METGLLREFLILAEEKNYWKAAERLYMNQSTLSKHIKTLEKTLSVPLFDRTTRMVELTEYGRLLLPYAQTMVQTQADCDAALLRQRELFLHTVRIDCVPTMAQYGLAGLMLRFRDRHPEYPLRVREIDSYQAHQALSLHTCELIISWRLPSSPPSDDSSIVTIPFIQDRLVLVVEKRHPLFGQRTVSISELKKEHLCFLKGYPYELAQKACQEAGFLPQVACYTDCFENILDVISGGTHAALLMERYVQYALTASPHLAKRFTAIELIPTVPAALSLRYLRDIPLSPAAQCFLAFFEQWRRSI